MVFQNTYTTSNIKSMRAFMLHKIRPFYKACNQSVLELAQLEKLNQDIITHIIINGVLSGYINRVITSFKAAATEEKTLFQLRFTNLGDLNHFLLCWRIPRFRLTFLLFKMLRSCSCSVTLSLFLLFYMNTWLVWSLADF